MSIPDGRYRSGVQYGEQYNVGVYFIDKRVKTSCAAKSAACRGEN